MVQRRMHVSVYVVLLYAVPYAGQLKVRRTRCYYSQARLRKQVIKRKQKKAKDHFIKAPQPTVTQSEHHAAYQTHLQQDTLLLDGCGVVIVNEDHISSRTGSLPYGRCFSLSLS